MAGGLMQLVAYGAQDIYLTGNPQITFFKVVYRRHTNFSMEARQQTFNGTADFGSRVSATIDRSGDLVGRMYVECDPSLVMGTNQSNGEFQNPLHQLLKEVEVEIGGQRIDKHYNHWLNVWTELTENQVPGASMKADGSYEAGQDAPPAVGPTNYQRMAMNVKGPTGSVTLKETYGCVPLQFWFCRNPGLALPLIALQYHEVKVTINFDTMANVTKASDGVLGSVKLWADYIYLDTDERRRFAQVSHEYLIEQLQYQSETTPASTFTLNFNHPVKEIIWAGKRAGGMGTHGCSAAPQQIYDNTDLDRFSTTNTCTLKLNGHERFPPRLDGYFTRTQVWQHHSANTHGHKQDAVHVYSFALKPEEHQPSGTCNFSRIDTAQLVYAASIDSGNAAAGLHIYAVNYNVLRIMSGMGGLAYSN